MKVVAYQPQYREDFIRLNTHWIEKYFTMEQADREVLQHVEEHIRQGAAGKSCVGNL